MPELVARASPRLHGAALRARGAPAAARAPPRLEGDPRARRPRRSCSRRCTTGARRLGPASTPLRARYAETAGAEPLARLQDLDLGRTCRRPADEDRPASAWPTRSRPACRSSTRRRRAGARAADVREGARAWRRSGCCARSRRAAAAARGRARRQARLLDPDGRVAARPAAAVRARPARAGAIARGGVLEPAPSRGCSTSTSRAATTTRARCGACCASSCGAGRRGAMRILIVTPDVAGPGRPGPRRVRRSTSRASCAGSGTTSRSARSTGAAGAR